MEDTLLKRRKIEHSLTKQGRKLIKFGFDPATPKKSIVLEGHLFSPLAFAAFKGDVDLCEWVHKFGKGDIRERGSLGRAPIHWAAIGGHLSVCKWLLYTSFHTDEKKPLPPPAPQELPQQLQIQERHTWGPNQKVECIMMEEVDNFLCLTDGDGKTVLYHAVFWDHLEVADWLITKLSKREATKNVLASDKHGITPLHAALFWEQQQSCKWLIRHGALCDDESGHINTKSVAKNMLVRYSYSGCRNGLKENLALLDWAKKVVNTHQAFVNPILLAICGGPAASSHLWKLDYLDELTNTHFKQLISAFLGITTARELRNIREFINELEVIMNNGDILESDTEDDEDEYDEE